MTTVLAVDSAGPVIGACVLRDGLEREWSERVRRGADTAMIPAIAELLCRRNSWIWWLSRSVQAFTSCAGVAAALGVVVSYVPVVCVSSLEARAWLQKVSLFWRSWTPASRVCPVVRLQWFGTSRTKRAC